MTLRLAVWSGPRNISTALMRSWDSRDDTVVTDEPLYACYLDATGLEHPGREDVLVSQGRDWRDVAAWLTGPPPQPAAIWYQKHMAHHLLPDIDRGWLDDLTNVVLIRDPRHVLPSLAKVLDEVRLADTGYAQQVEIAERTGAPVVDADDVLTDPLGTLARLCEAVGVGFDEAMLHWAPGPRPTDGVWAPHWYAAVEASTGFGPPRTDPEPLPDSVRSLLDECVDHYTALRARAL